MTEGEEFRFQIDAYTPDTIPMARLAEYVAELAKMLGEQKAVHFLRLEPGSTAVLYKTEHEAVPKVRERTMAVKRGMAPRDAQGAYRKINKLLREDNGKAVIKEQTTGAEIIQFPGRDEAKETFLVSRHRGAVDGEVIRVGGSKEWVPITLESETQQISYCFAKRALAKRLAHRLFEPVRLVGEGTWGRDKEGNWTLHLFRVDDFEPLQVQTLTDALAGLRAIPVEWDSDSIAEASELRGEQEKQNGGS